MLRKYKLGARMINYIYIYIYIYILPVWLLGRCHGFIYVYVSMGVMQMLTYDYRHTASMAFK